MTKKKELKQKSKEEGTTIKIVDREIRFLRL